MRIQTLFSLLAVTVLVGACSSPNFKAYQDSDALQGTGTGALRIIDGIDFWEYGDCDRKYKILGVIEFNHKRGLLSMTGDSQGKDDDDSAIAKAAHEHGGDAVIFIGGDPPPSAEKVRKDVDDHGQNRQWPKLVLIKYVQ